MTTQQTPPNTFFAAIDWSTLSSVTGDGTDVGLAGLRHLGLAVADFFDRVGVAFKPARSDVAGNVRKIADAAASLGGVASVGELLSREAAAGLSAKDPSGTVGLLWFKRAMEYLYAVLSLLLASRVDDDEDTGMSELCRQAYEMTLKPRHAWLVQKTFSALMSAAPYKRKFLDKLVYRQQQQHGSNDDDQACLPPSRDAIYAAMATGLVSMRRLLDGLNAALCHYGVETPPLPDLAALGGPNPCCHPDE